MFANLLVKTRVSNSPSFWQHGQITSGGQSSIQSLIIFARVFHSFGKTVNFKENISINKDVILQMRFYNNNSYIEVDANEEIMHIIFHSTKTNVLQYKGIWPPHDEARIEECSYWIDQRSR